MVDLKGKVALVTGGAGGLGRDIAEVLLHKGCLVSLIDTNYNLGEKTAAELQEKHGLSCCRFFKCDVTNDAQLEECFKATRSAFGGLDILVNNAGLATHQDFRKLFNVNTVAVYSGILLAFKYMSRENGYSGGHVINVASMSAVNPMPCAPDYTASKWAVFGMTRCFGTDLYYNRHGVRVNCLCPGPMKTKLFYDLLDHLRSSNKTATLVEEYDKETITTHEAAQGVLKLIKDQRNGSALTMMTATDVSYYEH